MKKILFTLLMISSLFYLAACGNESGDKPDDKTSDQNTLPEEHKHEYTLADLDFEIEEDVIYAKISCADPNCSEVLLIETTAEEDIYANPDCTNTGLMNIYVTFEFNGIIQNHVIKDVVVPALGHDYVSYKKKEATCTEEGHEAYQKCSRCFEDNFKVIPKLDHEYVSEIERKEPTCEEYGYVVMSCKCSETKIIDLENLGHDIIFIEGQSATCTEDGYYDYEKCQRLGCEYNTFEPIEASGHDNSNFIVIKEPTCTLNGLCEATCHCGTTFEFEIDATGHSYSSNVVDPTEVDYGYTEYICLNCKDTYKDNYVDSISVSVLEFVLNEDNESYGVRFKETDKEIISITIPQTYKGLPVTKMLDTNYQNKKIKTICLPSSIKYIEDNAFHYVSNAPSYKGVKILYNGSINDWCNIIFETEQSNPMYCGDQLPEPMGREFYILSDSNEYELLKNLVIPEEIEAIGNYQFAHFYQLESVVLPNSVKIIGQKSFYYCENLKIVDFGQGLEMFTLMSFAGCTSLKNVNLPESLSEIGYSTFQGCTSLVSINIPNKVKTLQMLLFYYCTNLKTIIIGLGVNYIDSTVFMECRTLNTIHFAGTQQMWDAILYQNIPGAYDGEYNPFPYVTKYFYKECIHDDDSFVWNYNEQGFISYENNRTYEVINDATCEEPGLGKYNCSCGAEEVVIEPKGHTLTYHPYNDATCLLTGNNAYYSCGECEKYFADEQALDTIAEFSWVIDELGHNAVIDEKVDSTCTETGLEEGSHCDRCGMVLVAQEIIEAKGHTESILERVEPTCEESGLGEGKKCTVCHDVYEEQLYLAPLGHILDDGTKVLPTEISQGYTRYLCTREDCEYYEDRQFQSRLLTYKLSSDRTHYIITGASGDALSITVPSTYQNLPVKVITKDAFGECWNLKTLVIPDSVTEIEQGALFFCISLESLTIPFVGGNADGGLLAYIFNTATVSNNKGAIPTTLKTLIIEGSTSTVLQNNALSNISSLTRIEIKIPVTQTGNNVMANCENLETVILPDTLTKLSDSTFSKCPNLKNIKLNEGLKTIGKNVFEDNTSLESIHIPASVTSISTSIFAGCLNLTTITVDEGNTKYDSRNNCNGIVLKSNNSLIAACGNTVIDKTIVTIGNYAYCKAQIDTITIPANITTIGSYAFKGSSVKQVIFDENSNLTKIDSYAFSGATNLESINLEVCSVLNEIWHYSFDGCQSLTSIVIPSNVTRIFRFSFYNASGLSSVTLPENGKLYEIGQSAFYGCSFEEIYIPSTVTIVDNDAFSYNKSLKTVIFADDINLVEIGSRAFYRCNALESVNIPASVTLIDYEAFAECFKLSNLKFAEDSKLETIEYMSFYACRGLTSLKIPGSVKTIKDEAFSQCNNVAILTFEDGEALTIGEEAFSGFNKLRTLILTPRIVKLGNKAFGQLFTLYVYFDGTVEEWANITIGTNVFPQQTIYYYSEEAPSDDTNSYWHYVDGVVTIW